MYHNFRLYKNSGKFLKLFVYITTVLAMTGCNTSSKEAINDITGVYKLLPSDKGYEVVSGYKIYTEDYYMFVKRNNIESISTFEIGTYELNNNKISLKSIYSSHGDEMFENKTSSFQVEKNEEGAIEIFTDPDHKQKSNPPKTERYKYIAGGEASKSAIDGAWKQIANYSIHGKDTIWDPGTNYKIVSDGYFMWGAFHHFEEQTETHQTYMGAGRTLMNGKTDLTEKVLISSWPTTIGRSIPIEVEFQNDNVFKQTIEDSNTGIKYIEIYQRL